MAILPLDNVTLTVNKTHLLMYVDKGMGRLFLERELINGAKPRKDYTGAGKRRAVREEEAKRHEEEARRMVGEVGEDNPNT